MVQTRNSCTEQSGANSSMASIEISDGVKKYLEQMNAELKSELLTLKEEINQRNEHISHLEERVVQVVQQNVKLAADLHVTNKKFDALDIKLDDLEQYGRKMCLRVEGIEVKEKESNSNLTTKVIDCLNEIGANVSQSDFSRLHRSGKPIMRDGRLVAQTIVKFTSWQARSRVFATRFSGTHDERMARKCFVHLDLTKRHLGLLQKAQVLLKKHPFAHVYANADCKLIIYDRVASRKYFFNDELEMEKVISTIDSFA
jgi:hypothetical protein